MKKIAASLLLGSFLGSAAAQAPDISEIQKKLQQHGYEIKAISGIMDASTKHALMSFQLDHDLPAEAQLDDATLAALMVKVQSDEDVKDVVNTAAPVFEIRGEDLSAIQDQVVRETVSQALQQRGYETERLDDAIVSFQLDQNIPAQGQLDQATMAALGLTNAEKQPDQASFQVKTVTAELSLPAFPGQSGAVIAGPEEVESYHSVPATEVEEEKVVALASAAEILVEPEPEPEPEPAPTPKKAVEPSEASNGQPVGINGNRQATEKLAELGYDISKPLDALKLFQLDNDLPAEGQLDKATVMALIDATEVLQIAQPNVAAAALPDSEPLQQEVSEPLPEVDLVQLKEALERQGYDTADLNEAVKLFQLDNDLPAEGQLDEPTLAKLLAPVAATPVEAETVAAAQTSVPVAIPAPTLQSDEDYWAHLAELGYQLESRRESLILFQLDNDIPAEGELNDETKNVLTVAKPLAQAVIQPSSDDAEADIVVQPIEELTDVDWPVVEQALADKGYDLTNRKAALKLFQLDSGLPAEGQLDRATLAALLGESKAAVLADPRYRVPDDPAVQDVVERLAAHGYAVDSSDKAVWNNDNRNALVLFQLDHEIPAEAQLDEATLVALFTKILPEPKPELTSEPPVVAVADDPEDVEVEQAAAGDAAVVSQKVDAAGEQVNDAVSADSGNNEAAEVAEQGEDARFVELPAVSKPSDVIVSKDDSASSPVDPLPPVKAVEPKPVEPLVVADDDEQHRAEKRLVALHYLDTANGRWTAWDRRALTFFQLENLLAPSGELDAETIAALYADTALPDPQRAGDEKVAVAAAPVVMAAPAPAPAPAPKPEPIATAVKPAATQKPEPTPTVAKPTAVAAAKPKIQAEDALAAAPAKNPEAQAVKGEPQKLTLPPAVDTAKAEKPPVQAKRVDGDKQGAGFLTAKVSSEASALAAINAMVDAAKKPQANNAPPEKLQTSPATRPATVAEANKPIPKVKPPQEKIKEPPKALTPDIELVQKRLQEAGFYDGEIDGKKGPKLTRGIKYFQLINNLPASGKLDQTTLRLLYRREAFVRQ